MISGTKAFISGEILTSNDVNQYLMRGVKVFASTAVRDAAYGGAGEPVLYEGETCYITATDVIQTYNGTSWVDIGPTTQRIPQVVQTVKTDAFSTTSTTLVDVTGLSASITPSRNTNSVLVMVQTGISCDASGVASPYISLLRGATQIYLGDAAGSRPRVSYGLNGTTVGIGHGIWQGTLVYLDSPATTSSTTYKVQMRTSAGGTVCLNRTLTDTDNVQFPRTPSTITLLEVSA